SCIAPHVEPNQRLPSIWLIEVRSVQGIFLWILPICFFVFASISKYPSDVPTTSFPLAGSIQVKLLPLDTLANFLFAGEKVLIDLLPKIQKILLASSNLMSFTSSLERVPSHNVFESFRRFKL